MFFNRPYLKSMGVAFGFVFGLTWPVIVWILLKSIGYALIGLTFGCGRQFVDSTFFLWTNKMGVTFSQLLDLARPPSVIVGKVCKRIRLSLDLRVHCSNANCQMQKTEILYQE